MVDENKYEGSYLALRSACFFFLKKNLINIFILFWCVDI